ncbi:MAG TPA: hypothetical protein VGQ45_14930 [Gaiellales bacterium]|jgi:MFS family permease|nr:hypothetical protein [Gaiellales bacterium]
MNKLILFRSLPGLGGGALMVSTQAVIGDIVPPRDRGRYCRRRPDDLRPHGAGEAGVRPEI